MKPVVIIGAGLTGLACASHLHRKGFKFVLLEAQSKVGGRVSSKRTEKGFLVDDGFQVILDSYPELDSVVSLDSLELQPFHSGALIFDGKGMNLLANPFRHPLATLKTLSFPHSTLKDSALVVSLMFSAQKFKSDASLGRTSTLTFLQDFGFSHVFIENFWKPFLTGVYLDPNLAIGSHFFLFLIRCFAWGRVCLPKNGMEQLPIQIASTLPPKSIRLNSSVKSWTDREVVLTSNEKIEASHVVCAFNTSSAQNVASPQFRNVSTHYFTSPQLHQLGWDKWLILIPQRLGITITHLALVSSVASNYGNSGQPLLSASIVGDDKTEPTGVIEEIEKLAGRPLQLSWVATTHVPRALPIVFGETPGFEHKNGIFYCGDQYASPSINGALRSGRLAAESILSES